MQEIAFPGFKFQKFSGDYASTHVASGHWYPPLIGNDKLRLIFFFTFCAFFPSFISNTSIVSTNFRANMDAQNAGNSISVLQISKNFWGVHAHPRDHCYPPLISNDKLWLTCFFTFCAFFPSFISNTSIVSINFGANLDAQNAGNGISVLQISKNSGGVHPQPPPIHAWYIGHTRGLQPLLSPSNILSHRKVPFQKMPPTGKSLKKTLIQ
jgi:hypothetical protein